MNAYLTVLYDKLKKDKVTVEGIFDFLNTKGIVFGVKKDEIKKIVASQALISNFVVAKGEGMPADKNTFVEYHIDMGCSIIPAAKNDGSVDFSEIKDIVYVHKGDKICDIRIPSGRLECRDIFGKKFIPDTDAYLPQLGSGVEYNTEECRVYAALDGYVNYSDETIDVMPALQVKDDIGDGVYDSNVVIYAHIKEGKTIRSTGNIIIFGDLKDVNVESGKNIVIYGSLKDSEKCMVKAVGNITCKFIEDINLYCGGNIYTTHMVKCVAKAGKSIVASGEGLIKSGRYTVGENVSAGVLGDRQIRNLIINIWENWYESENNTDDDKSKLIQCEAELSELREQYMQLGDNLETLKKMNVTSAQKNANKARMIRNVTLVRAKVMTSMINHRKYHEKLSEKINNKRIEIACSGEIYRGVRFRIGQESYAISDDVSNRAFFLNGEGVFLYRQYK